MNTEASGNPSDWSDVPGEMPGIQFRAVGGLRQDAADNFMRSAMLRMAACAGVPDHQLAAGVLADSLQKLDKISRLANGPGPADWLALNILDITGPPPGESRKFPKVENPLRAVEARLESTLFTGEAVVIWPDEAPMLLTALSQSKGGSA